MEKKNNKSAKKNSKKSLSEDEITLSKELDIANRLADVLLEALEDKNQFNRYLIKGKESTDEVIFDKIDMDSFNSALKALKSLEEIKRVMKESVSVSSVNENTHTGVVILPVVEEENNEN